MLGAPLLLALLDISGMARAATPNDYPARPVRLISPFAPGGGNDLISRTLGQEMSKNLGQPVVVDNRLYIGTGQDPAAGIADGSD